MVGPAGATLVALTVMVSTFGCDDAAILAGARLLFAMARDGVFLKACARIHERFRTPHIAIIALVVWSSVLALSGSYEQLFTYVMFASLLLHMVGAIGVFRLRRLRPDLPRPYRVWGYPIVPAIFIVASGAFVLNILIERPKESLTGLGLLALGLPVYWFSKRSTEYGANERQRVATGGVVRVPASERGDRAKPPGKICCESQFSVQEPWAATTARSSRAPAMTSVRRAGAHLAAIREHGLQIRQRTPATSSRTAAPSGTRRRSDRSGSDRRGQSVRQPDGAAAADRDARQRHDGADGPERRRQPERRRRGRR
jgi:hypothetical protein